MALLLYPTNLTNLRTELENHNDENDTNDVGLIHHQQQEKEQEQQPREYKKRALHTQVVTMAEDEKGDDHVTPSSNKRRRVAKKSVKFNEVLTVQERYCSVEDFCNAWYQDRDYCRFKTECAYTLRTVHAVHGDTSQLDSKIFCIRGLEHQLIQRLWQMKKQRKNVLVRSILQQQAMYKACGMDSSDALRLISEWVSKESNFLAQSLGRVDTDNL